YIFYRYMYMFEYRIFFNLISPSKFVLQGNITLYIYIYIYILIKKQLLLPDSAKSNLFHKY
ncbi:MAG: hypothetical protein N7Q72_06835, partial [Spiroplasma sp. Tabriz.8]|nr:hypothetical protein [Spiroplasma sp. Tabriz.8]